MAPDDGTPWLNPDEQGVWRQWLYVTNRLNSVLNAALVDDAGISLQDFSVLVGLSESPKGRSRVAQLADQLQWERSRLSHQVARMVKRGLVSREECGQDLRGHWIVITASGQEVLESAARGHVREVRAHMFDLMSAADLEALGRITHAMRENLGDVNPRAQLP